jgi:hypothetical protein
VFLLRWSVFLAVSFFLSFAQVDEMTVRLPLRSFAVLVQGGMSVDIFSHFGSCCWANLSSVVVLGWRAREWLFVGIEGGMVVGCCAKSLVVVVLLGIL